MDRMKSYIDALSGSAGLNEAKAPKPNPQLQYNEKLIKALPARCDRVLETIQDVIALGKEIEKVKDWAKTADPSNIPDGVFDPLIRAERAIIPAHLKGAL